MKKIGVGGDHAGYPYKEKLIAKLKAEGYKVTDFGPESNASADYPDYAHPLASAVAEGKVEQAIAICGSGNGVCMTVNKHPSVRGALVWNNELAALSRRHNDANVLCLPARFVTYELAEEMTHTFLNTDFEGGRHQRRVDKI